MIKVVLSLPNWLTLLRVVLIPIFVFLLVNPSDWMIDAAVYIFIFAAITDYLDGFIARYFKSVTDFGKLLDPLADKVLVLSALIMLVGLKNDLGEAWVPGWMVVMVVAREIWITGLRGVAASGGVIVAANMSGKVKSFLQMAAVVCLLLHDRIIFHLFGLTFTYQWIGLNLLFLSLIFSYVGAVQYTMLIFFTEDSQGISSEQNKDAG